MNLDFGLNLNQQQKLIMSQNMQLSIKILQMSSYELREYIDKEFEQNPVLEGEFEVKDEQERQCDKLDYKEIVQYLEFDNYTSRNSEINYEDKEVSPFNFIAESKGLKDFLYDQICISKESEYIKNIVKYMVESLDNKGYLDSTLENICEELDISEDDGQAALDLLQKLEPDGIGARNIKECLINQLSKKAMLDSNIEEIILSYLELVADNKYNEIAKKIGISPKEAQDYGDLIKSLEPKPSRGYYTGDEVKYIVPDAVIRKIDGKYMVIMNDGIVPRLRVSSVYKKVTNNESDKEVKKYVEDKIDSALFLIKSIEQRKNTLFKIISKIVDKQEKYFDAGKEYLIPMTLKEIAEELEVHESTVSRAIKDKYILTAYGTMKIKDLFSNGITAICGEGLDIAVENIKNKIKSIIDSEDKKKPVSDQWICDELNRKNLNISRRTVAKYREEMGIKSSSKRRRI